MLLSRGKKKKKISYENPIVDPLQDVVYLVANSAAGVIIVSQHSATVSPSVAQEIMREKKNIICHKFSVLLKYFSYP